MRRLHRFAAVFTQSTAAVSHLWPSFSRELWQRGCDAFPAYTGGRRAVNIRHAFHAFLWREMVLAEDARTGTPDGGWSGFECDRIYSARSSVAASILTA